MRSVCPLSYFLTPLHFGMWELCTTKGKRRRACRRGSALQIRYSLTDEWEFFSPNYIFKDPQQQRDFEERCHDYDRRYTLSALIYRSIEPKWVRKLLIKTSYLWCMGKFCLAICISFACLTFCTTSTVFLKSLQKSRFIDSFIGWPFIFSVVGHR